MSSSSGDANEATLLPNTQVEFGLSWEHSPNLIDLDLQLVAVDLKGSLVDAVYFNSPKGCQETILHGGDERTGKTPGMDETILLNLAQIPSDIGLLICMVFSNTPNTLAAASSAQISFYSKEAPKPTVLWQMPFAFPERGAFAAVIQRTPQGFVFTPYPQPILGDCPHFMDALPTISKLICHYYPTAPDIGKLCFSMAKEDVVSLGSKQNSIVVGLGWDAANSAIDLDVSCVLLGRDGQLVDVAFFHNKVAQGGAVVHSGDNRTGEGDGDDEKISLNLDSLSKEVAVIFFIINTYTKGLNFSQVKNAYCRVIDSSLGQEVCHYKVRKIIL
eukprot:GHVP01067247.1.p1 GENE.GHVP01067247.1~~GHVP01067247.1.p1  ORF type:complete len:330 (+),score=55.55 GHVP01067247.1:425-1414(+)